MKRFTALALAVILTLCLAPWALAADGVERASGGAGGSMVYITMLPGRAIVPAVANGSIHTDVDAASLVASAQDEDSSVVAAINGGFFNSYYSAGEWSVPNNYPQVFSTIVYEGRLINCGGTVNAVGFTYDGQTLIDRVKLAPLMTLDGVNAVNLWGVNTYYNDSSAICMYTAEFDYAMTIPDSSYLVTVRDYQVVSAERGGTVSVSDGDTQVVYGAAAWQAAEQWNLQPKVGQSAVFSFTAEAESTDSAMWDNARTAIAGGSLLVQGGVNVAYSNEVSQENQKPDVVGQRSYVALLGDGRLVLGTVSSSFAAIADYLVSIGATAAVGMDGGGSSMLYEGGSFITYPGRKLATALVVVDETTAAARPESAVIAQQVISKADDPSDWAQEPVSRAVSLELVPEKLRGSYRSAINRAEFCELIMQTVRAKLGCSFEYYCTYTGITTQYTDVSFTDTDSYFVRYCALAGLVNGVGNGAFDPFAEISRQDAAAILRRMAQFIGAVEAGSPQSFSDSGLIADYARDAVDYVSSQRIMNGDGTNFNPLSSITREEAIMTMLNAYDYIERAPAEG